MIVVGQVLLDGSRHLLGTGAVHPSGQGKDQLFSGPAGGNLHGISPEGVEPEMI
jgi:hypothetical protein